MSHKLKPDALILIALSSFFQPFPALHFPFSLGLVLNWDIWPRGEHSLSVSQFMRPVMHKLHRVTSAPVDAMGWIQKNQFWKDPSTCLICLTSQSVVCFGLPCWRETVSPYDKVTEVPSCSNTLNTWIFAYLKFTWAISDFISKLDILFPNLISTISSYVFWVLWIFHELFQSFLGW